MQLLMCCCGETRRSQLVCLELPLLFGFFLNWLNTTFSLWFAIFWFSPLQSCFCGPMLIHLSTSNHLVLFIVFNWGINNCRPWVIYLSTFLLFSQSVLYYRTPPRIPQVHLPEEPFLQVASALTFEINRGFAVLRDIASGKDLKKFLIVCSFFIQLNYF